MAQPPLYTTTTNYYSLPTSEPALVSSVVNVPSSIVSSERLPTGTPHATTGYVSTETLSANQANQYVDSPNFWNNLEEGAKIGVVLVVVIGTLCIALFSMWYCCGCC